MWSTISFLPTMPMLSRAGVRLTLTLHDSDINIYNNTCSWPAKKLFEEDDTIVFLLLRERGQFFRRIGILEMDPQLAVELQWKQRRYA